MKTLLLIDLSGIFWRCWHATKDQETSAAFEQTLGMVHKLRDGYDYVAICCDAPPYDRKKLSPDYKANREAAPPLALDQFRRVKERLAADGLLLWEHPGAEADDVIAWASRTGDLDVTVASSDKDLLQLVREDIGGPLTVLNPFDNKRYDRQAVIEKFGVAPENMPDFLALVGDKSDNVPGVKGVGAVNAAKLLMEYGGLEGVICAAPALQSAIGQAILDQQANARLSKKLVTLRTDLPLNFAELFVERKPLPLTTDAEWEEDQAPEAKADAILAKAHPTQGIVVSRPVEWTMQLEPTATAEAWKVAQKFHESRLFTKLGGIEAHFMAILRGRALGLDAATSCASFHNIKGRLTLSAEIVIGLVLRSGKAEYFECTETNDDRATWVTKRNGGRSELSVTWDMERALKANLVSKSPNGGYRGISSSGEPSNWDKYPRTMLRWRAATELAHAVYADVVTGLVTPDEAAEDA